MAKHQDDKKVSDLIAQRASVLRNKKDAVGDDAKAIHDAELKRIQDEIMKEYGN